MALDPLLLDILACPEDKGPLFYLEDEDTLYNPRLTRRYNIRDGIPIMLIDEAETVDAPEHERIMARISAEAIKPTFVAGPDVAASQGQAPAGDPALSAPVETGSVGARPPDSQPGA